MASQLVKRSIPLNKVTKEWNSATYTFARPGGTLLFPDAPSGVHLTYLNRVKGSPGVLPVKFAFAQQRVTPDLYLADPPDADPILGYLPHELVDADWDRGGTYGPGRFARGGHRHTSPQTVLRPTIVNRPEDTWLEAGNPPVDHSLRLMHEGWFEAVDLGGRMYGPRALSWWPEVYWKSTGVVVQQGTHNVNHYYRQLDNYLGPMVLFPEGFVNVCMPSQASLDSLSKGGWYVGPDRFNIFFSDHKVPGDRVYELTMTLNYPSLLSLDVDPTGRDAVVYATRRTDGLRRVVDADGNIFQGKFWADAPLNVTCGPPPELGRDNETWVMVPALRLFTELKVADPKGWVPSAASKGISDAKQSEYYGRMLSFSTKDLTGWPDHQHSEYLAAFSKGAHFPHLPGLPDWQRCLDAVARWTENQTLPATILWYRGCENVELEFDPGVVVPPNPWPAPVEDWDGTSLIAPAAPVAPSRARFRLVATSGGDVASAQVMIDMRDE